jgi:amino acid adenylation domain-containing protein
MSHVASRMAALSEPQRRLLERRLESLAVDFAEIPVLPGGTEAGPAPLSFPQQRLWFLQELDPGTTAYSLQWAIRLQGPLDVAVLRRCLSEIVRRHEILRTRFAWRDGELVQVVAPTAAMPMRVEELRGLAHDEQSRRLRHLAHSRALRPFDLARGSLVEVDLLRLGDERHVLCVTLHHIVADGWSQGVFLRELGALYEAFKAGRPSPLEPLPVQYRGFAVWQRRWLRDRWLEEPLRYWRRQLDGLPALSLPSDRVRRDAEGTAQAGVVKLALPGELVDRLGALGRELGATPFMVLLAGLQAVLGAYSGQTDFAVGTSIANRRRAELEGLIGFFANSLVLRARLDGDPRFAELVRRVREVCLGAYEHQDLPFERLVEELRPARDPSRHPLFQVMLHLHNAPVGRPELAGLDLTLEDAEVGAARFDLEVMLTGGAEGGIAGWLLYRRDLFERALVEGLAGSLRRLLEDAAAHPRRRLSELVLLEAAERERLLGEWASGRPSEVPHRCLHELVEEVVAARPEARAVLCGEQVLSYGELDRRANRLAWRLRELGVRPEARVAVCLDRSADLVVALLGVLKAGGAYMPLDPAYPPERLLYMLRDSGAAVLLTEPGPEERLAGFEGAVVRLDGVEEPGRADAPVAGVRPDNLAYLIYTSGSTGRPKGVMISHHSLVNFLCAMASELPITDRDVILATTTLSFDIAGLEIWGALTTGACVSVAANPLSGDWRAFQKLVERHEVTTMQGTPSTWRFLLDRGWAPPAGLRVLCGGEALPADLARRLRRGGWPLWNLYGPSETTVWSALDRIDDVDKVVPLGSPIANTQLYVLNQSLRLVPVGVAGELHIGGDGLARGYLGRPATTAERFVPNPFSGRPGERLYRTGDVVCRRADGTLQFLGRTDQQVKIRGHRIEPGEIESTLRQHPTVAEAAVTTVADPNGMPSVAAYLQPRQPAAGEAVRRDRAAEQEHLDHWHEVWTSTYEGDLPPAAADLDTVGWRSSYDGEPIPAAEMAEWADHAAEAIRRLRPRRVLEIGCGTGMLLLRLAPDCEAYWATDTAAGGLTRLAATIRAAGLPPGRVRLLCQPAHVLSGLEGERFDAIVLNSVVQYFPSTAYLTEVLEAALRLLEPGGAIFVGDVRNLDLLQAFQLSVHSHSAPPDLPLDQLRRRVADAVLGEEELLLSPSLFAAFAQAHGGLTADIRCKLGKADNELSRYRYDVILRSGGTALDPDFIDWTALSSTPEQLVSTIQGCDRPLLGVAGVPNPRLAADARRLRLLDELGGGTVAELRAAVERGGDQTAPQLEDLRSAAGAAGYSPACSPSRSAEPFCLDVVLRGGEAGGRQTPVAWRMQPASTPPPPDWQERFANQPLRARESRRLLSELRAFLRERLPEAMVPSRLVIMDELPLTPNGKVDRQRLPASDWQGASAARPFVPPRTPTEETCARIFADLLDLPRVGIDDDFFELGGHSLLSARLAAELEAEFKVYVPLQTIFQRATVANLASIVEQALLGAAGAGTSGGDGSVVILPAPLAAAIDTELDPAITPAWTVGADQASDLSG